MTRLAAGLVGVLALVGAACQQPFIPAGTERITPPPEYRQWWEESRACVHRQEVRRFTDVEWYITPEMPVTKDGVQGWALTVGNKVYVWEPFRDSPWIIQHELVHAINGVHGHPNDPFVTCRLMAWQWV